MTLELTIQSMFDHYPLIFQTRFDCLNHLFCTLGNGLDWEDGELTGVEEPVNSLTDGKAHQHHVDTARSRAIRRAKAYAAIHGGTIDESSYTNIPDTPCVSARPRRERWYFVHRFAANQPERIDLYKDYVPLWNIPPDVKPDWLAGATECMKMLLEDGVVQESDAATLLQKGI